MCSDGCCRLNHYPAHNRFVLLGEDNGLPVEAGRHAREAKESDEVNAGWREKRAGLKMVEILAKRPHIGLAMLLLPSLIYNDGAVIVSTK